MINPVDLFVLLLLLNTGIVGASLSFTLNGIMKAWKNKEHFNYDQGKNVFGLLNPNIAATLIFLTFATNILLAKLVLGYRVVFSYTEITLVFTVFLALLCNFILVYLTADKCNYKSYTLICSVCTVMITVILIASNILTFLKLYPNT